MNGITFGNHHTWRDFGLAITSKEISAPEAKTHYVEVEGANGSLDFSEAFGDVKYKRRHLKYTLTSLAVREAFWTDFSRIQNALHGREFRIIDDEDPDFYYIGRVTIDRWKIDKAIGSMTIEAEVEPFKYRMYETVRTEAIGGEAYIAFWNDRMTVTPVFRATAPMTIVRLNGSEEVANSTVTVNAVGSDFSSHSLQFREGNTTLKVTGTGTLTVRYQEGSL